MYGQHLIYVGEDLRRSGSDKLYGAESRWDVKESNSAVIVTVERGDGVMVVIKDRDEPEKVMLSAKTYKCMSAIKAVRVYTDCAVKHYTDTL